MSHSRLTFGLLYKTDYSDVNESHAASRFTSEDCEFDLTTKMSWNLEPL